MKLLKNIKPEYLDAIQIIFVLVLLYSSWRGHELAVEDKDKWAFRAALLVSIIIAALSVYKLWLKFGKKDDNDEEVDTDEE